MPEEVLSSFPDAFPIRLRGYDRQAVDQELHALRNAVDFIQADRDQAIARVVALETQLESLGANAPQHADNGDEPTSPASATIQWLMDTAQQEAVQIRMAAEEEAARYTQQAERLLRQRVEMVEQAQREADACRAQAAEEARAVVHEALEQASILIRDLREREASLQTMFGSGNLSRRPSTQQSADQAQQIMPQQASPPMQQAQEVTHMQGQLPSTEAAASRQVD